MDKYLILLICTIFMLVGCGSTVGKMNDSNVTRALPSAEDLQAESEGSSNNDPTNTGASNFGLLHTEPASGIDSTVSVMTPVVPGGVVDLSELDDEVVPSNGTKELVEQPMPGAPDATGGVIELTIQDLANRLGSNPKEIQMVEIEAVEWTSSALGCPAPGASYLTVLVPGHRITLATGGDHYVYHTDSRQQIVLCDDNNRLSP